MDRLGYVMIQLLRWELTGTFADGFEPSDISAEELMQLYPLALQHDMAHLVGDAIDQLGLLPVCNLSEQYAFQVLQAHYRQERFQHALEELCICLDAAHICYLPLKGCVLRSLYPEPWMRTSCDIDLLLHAEDIPRAEELLTQKLHYRLHYAAAHDVEVRSEDGVSIELHFDLIEDGRVGLAHGILSGVWEYARPQAPGSCLYVMDKAMFAFYHIAHMAKHVTTGGCGVRTFLDLWILEQDETMWSAELIHLLQEGELWGFACAVQRLNQVWFEGAQPDETLLQFMNFVLEGGAHGNKKNACAAAQLRAGGKRSYITSRVFLSYEDLKYQYPILQKHRWLLPVCEVRRWCSLLFGSKGKNRQVVMRTILNLSQEEISGTAKLFEQLGLS